MNQGRYRWLLRLAVLIAVGGAFLLWAKQKRSQNVLTIQNRSGQSISRLEVTFSGETKTFQNVREGSDVAVTPIQMDAPLVLTGRLADDTRIKANFGQIPAGPAGEPPTLLVVPGGQIMVRQGNKNSP
jgi:hypothetical protein